MKNLLIHFARFGPYHLARLRSAQETLEPLGWRVRGLQICSSDSIYEWADTTVSTDAAAEDADDQSDVLTVFPGAHYETLSRQQMDAAIRKCLDRESPDAMSIAGWGSSDARICLDWCSNNQATAVLMSETRRVDGQRRWYKEWFKKRLVQRFDRALVGAASHADYLVELGMSRDRIGFGYNVVDDQFFAQRVDDIRATSQSDISPFVLASNRFVEIKNLERALNAFSRFSQSNDDGNKKNPGGMNWNLCLLGDGPLFSQLKEYAAASGLRVCELAPWDDREDVSEPGTVYFPGFVQVEQLPKYYALASVFFHPAISEPWGLVINEAMASGLPVIASGNGGAAETLLGSEKTGFLFDPLDERGMAFSLERMASLDCQQRFAMGETARQVLTDRMSSKHFGKGLASVLCSQTQKTGFEIQP